MWNTKCNLCGSNAYAGIFGISDCENTRCSNHKPKLITNNVQESIIKQVKNSSIEDEEEYALQILNFLQLYTQDECFLIGGALREWYFNRNAKDLDFFVNADPIGFKDYIDGKINNKIISYKQLSHTSKNGYPMFIDVYELDVENKLTCQIIDIKTNQINEILNTFDFNLNKAYISSKQLYQKVYTKEFIEDENNKKMTLNLSTMMNNRQYSSIKKVPSRIERMESLFPNFKLKVI